MLNRIRVGQPTAEDIRALQSRVRPLGHPDLEGAMHLSCTNAEVNKINVIGLNALILNLLQWKQSIFIRLSRISNPMLTAEEILELKKMTLLSDKHWILKLEQESC